MKRSDSQVFCFNAVSERKVQILRFAQDDNGLKPCHPERSEGSVRNVNGLRYTRVCFQSPERAFSASQAAFLCCFSSTCNQ